MPFSMTGYGRYNGRYLLGRSRDSQPQPPFPGISVRLPSKYLWLEVECTQVLKEFFQRGKIDARVQLEAKPETAAPKVVLMEDLVRQYLDRLNEAKKRFRLAGRPRVEHLLTIPGGFFLAESGKDDEKALGNLVLTAVREAARRLLEMREQETALGRSQTGGRPMRER